MFRETSAEKIYSNVLVINSQEELICNFMKNISGVSVIYFVYVFN
jgi:hypothetical protein